MALDEPAFDALVERHRRELQVHCYRMLGSAEEAEDMVQETFLRAWKARADFAGRSTARTWLYRIATNACLDALAGRARRVLPHHLAPPSAGTAPLPVKADIAWLQPLPDAPDTAVEERETIELAFLAAIQHLPPRQRAVLILRDVVGWSAKQTATQLDDTVAATNSALQRARATLREHLPRRRIDWAPSVAPTEREQAVLRQYMAAVEAADPAAMATLLTAEVRAVMPPWTMWFEGRDAVMAGLVASWEPRSPHFVGRFRAVPVGANGQPAAAIYLQRPGDTAFRAFAISVLRVDGERIAEMTAFHDTGLFRVFDLPGSLP